MEILTVNTYFFQAILIDIISNIPGNFVQMIGQPKCWQMLVMHPNLKLNEFSILFGSMSVQSDLSFLVL